MPEVNYVPNAEEQARQEAAALEAQKAGGNQEEQTLQSEQQAQQLLAQVLNGQMDAAQFIGIVEQSGLTEPVIRQLLRQLMGGMASAMTASEQ